MLDIETPLDASKFIKNDERILRVDRSATIRDLKELAVKTQESAAEYGVSIYQTIEDKSGSVYTVGEGTSIYEPEPPSELRGKIKSGVFVHCHPVRSNERSDDGRTLHILPSGNGFFSGDFEASIQSRVIGGYLNIASEYGMTMFIGIEGISRDDEVVRKLRKKFKGSYLGKQKVWKIITGERAGTAFVNSEFEEAVNDKLSMGDDVLLFSNTEELGVRYFLHLSWEKLEELKSTYGDLNNLCFGDGLEKLVGALKLHVPHKKNLGEAAVIAYATPQKR